MSDGQEIPESFVRRDVPLQTCMNIEAMLSERDYIEYIESVGLKMFQYIDRHDDLDFRIDRMLS